MISGSVKSGPVHFWTGPDYTGDTESKDKRVESTEKTPPTGRGPVYNLYSKLYPTNYHLTTDDSWNDRPYPFLVPRVLSEYCQQYKTLNYVRTWRIELSLSHSVCDSVSHSPSLHPNLLSLEHKTQKSLTTVSVVPILEVRIDYADTYHDISVDRVLHNCVTFM